MGEFQGFTDEGFDLLVQLRMHNSKDYYEQHKPDYQRLLLQPFQQLITDITPTLQAIEPSFQLEPKVGKCISRIRRDTRFTRDKSMYRDTMWFFIRKQSDGWLQGAGYYFELNPVGYRYGCGYFSPPPAEMAVYREMIGRNPKRFSSIVNPIMKEGHFTLSGDMYKRDMGNGELPAKLYDWYNRKSVYLSFEGSNMNDIKQPGFSSELAARFDGVKGLYRFFSEVCEEYHRASLH